MRLIHSINAAFFSVVSSLGDVEAEKKKYRWLRKHVALKHAIDDKPLNLDEVLLIPEDSLIPTGRLSRHRKGKEKNGSVNLRRHA